MELKMTFPKNPEKLTEKIKEARKRSKERANEMMKSIEFFELLEVIRQMDDKHLKRIKNCVMLTIEKGRLGMGRDNNKKHDVTHDTKGS